MTKLYANNAATVLASGITNVATSLTVATGAGALFPSTAGGTFMATLFQVSVGVESNWEIVEVTARSGDVFTITRAQEGTTGRAFSTGDSVELRLTAGALTTLATTSGTNTGDQTGGTPALVLGTANTAGTAATFVRTDDTILAFDATAPSTQAFGDAAAVGSATVAARRDHKHAMPAAPTSVSGNAGTVTNGVYTTDKDASGGVPGMTLFKINFKNAANTFTSLFTNSNTAARTYTFKDADGTVAFTSDIITSALTGYTSGAGTVASTDTILQAIQKLNGNDALKADLLSALLTGVGYVFLDKGNSSTTSQTITYSAGNHQKITVTGSFTINALAGLPASGNLAVGLLELVNGASSTVTWPSWNWIKPDGTTTTAIATYLAANTGRTAFQTSGTDFVRWWTRDGGTTVYARLV